MANRNRIFIERSGLTLEIEVYYHLGGINYFTGNNERRGYYISVSPVGVSRNEKGEVTSVSYTAFTGTKVMLLEVKRQSQSAMVKAEKLAEEKKEDLIAYVLRNNEPMVRAANQQ